LLRDPCERLRDDPERFRDLARADDELPRAALDFDALREAEPPRERPVRRAEPCVFVCVMTSPPE
jgi:hypothetical protein